MSSRIVLVALLLLGSRRLFAESELITVLRIQGTRLALDLETRAGEPFDMTRVERDVRRLWATRRFDDIQVTTDEAPRGMQVTFAVAERHRHRLRNVRFEPDTERLDVDIPKYTEIDAAEAGRMAAQIRQELIEQGYADANVAPTLVPAGYRSTDLVLKVTRGELYEFDEVRFAGRLGVECEELRTAFASIRPRRILPALGPLWGGWRLRTPYSTARLQSAIEKAHSLYLARGYFDARIEVAETRIAKGKVSVTLRVDSGPRYNITRLETAVNASPVVWPTGSAREAFGKELCRCLHREREAAEKRGEMVFAPRLELDEVWDVQTKSTVNGRTADAGPSVSAATRTERGPVVRVGRIEFRGHRVLSDSTLRKALVLHEGDLFDAGKLRRSVARLNRMAPLQGVDPADVRIEPKPDGELVDLTIGVKERPRGYWALSGPLGPLSAFGPLSYSIGSRLPAAGRGPFELSTYYATFSVAAWPMVFAGITGIGTSSAWGVVGALQRPSTPGQRWTSGILIAPQLGGRGTAAGYGFARFTEASRAVLRTDSPLAPTLTVPLVWRPRHAKDEAQPVPIGYIRCDAPKPRLAWLRGFATVLLDATPGVLLAGQGL